MARIEGENESLQQLNHIKWILACTLLEDMDVYGRPLVEGKVGTPVKAAMATHRYPFTHAIKTWSTKTSSPSTHTGEGH